MAELLIFTKDIQGDDVYRTAKLPKRGYVVTVQEDGWSWGKEELANPIFRILKFPGQPIKNFTQFLSWEAAKDQFTDPIQITNTLQMRQTKFNIDDPSLPSDVQTVIADDTRKQPTVTANVDPASAAEPVQPVQDPAVIGPSPTTF